MGGRCIKHNFVNGVCSFCGNLKWPYLCQGKNCDKPLTGGQVRGWCTDCKQHWKVARGTNYV